MTTKLSPAVLLTVGFALLATGCASPIRSGPPAGFAVDHQLTVKVPENARSMRIWFTLPAEDELQEVSDLKIDVSNGAPARQTNDSHGNRYVYLSIEDPRTDQITIDTRFGILRYEAVTDVDPAATRPLTDDERLEMSEYLKPSRYIVIDERVRKLAADITLGEQNPILASRRIYDWILGNIDYWVKDPANKKASKVGSSEYCLDSRTGNCTDFHSLFTALARASGIPTRMKYGSLFKPTLDGVDKDQSYHCWPEFWAPDVGWIPNDVAVADIYVDMFEVDSNNATLVELTTATGYSGPSPAMVDYYFGHLDNRRVTWSVGRDLVLVPPQDGEPVHAVPKAYVEVDGRPYDDWSRKLTYHEIANPGS